MSGPFSFAFVQSAGGVSMLRQGEAAEGWKLTGVKENTATFTKDGRTITLSLAKPEYDAASEAALACAAAGPSPASRSPQPTRRGRLVQLPPNPHPLGRPSTASGFARRRFGGAETIEVVVPPASWTRSGRIPWPQCRASVEPNMVNGQMQGFNIANVSADSVAAPDLSSGDRILAVNGTPINSVGTAMAMFQQLSASGASSVTVTMERGGQRLNVVYTVK